MKIEMVITLIVHLAAFFFALWKFAQRTSDAILTSERRASDALAVKAQALSDEIDNKTKDKVDREELKTTLEMRDRVYQNGRRR